MKSLLDIEGCTLLGSLELTVLVQLCLLALSDCAVQLSGLLGQHVGGVSAVLLHGSPDSAKLSLVVISHLLHALVGSSLVRIDHALQLLVLLQVLCVAVVSELHHALHLSVHVGVDLSLPM